MVRKMNLDGRARKALVAAIEELTDEKAIYRRMPTCSYDIGNITVLKGGSIDFLDGSAITGGLQRWDLQQNQSNRNTQYVHRNEIGRIRAAHGK